MFYLFSYNLTYDNGTGFWTSLHTELKVDRDSDVKYAYWMAALLHVSLYFVNIL